MNDELNRSQDSEFSICDLELAMQDKLFNDLQVLTEQGKIVEFAPEFKIFVPLTRQLNKSAEPFCWRQQYGLSMNEMFPYLVEELLDMEMLGKLEVEI